MSASEDFNVKIWNIAAGLCVLTLRGHSSPVKSVGISADGRYVVSGGSNGVVIVWKIDGGVVDSSKIGDSEVKCVEFSKNGKLLLAVTKEKVNIYDFPFQRLAFSYDESEVTCA